MYGSLQGQAYGCGEATLQGYGNGSTPGFTLGHLRAPIPPEPGAEAGVSDTAGDAQAVASSASCWAAQRAFASSILRP
ncbi:hypothetical protein GCM10010221_12800 [Streptomyces parvus]|nr:hypothetical protein GCM10010221_12800 [Streptomyces parvus]